MTMTNTWFFMSRGVAILYLIGLCLYLDSRHMILAYIVLGHAHFLGGYYYKYKSGKWTWSGLGLWFLLGSALFFWYQLGPGKYVLEMFVAIVFAIHMGVDEMYLSGRKANLQATFEILPFVIFYSAFTYWIISQNRLDLLNALGLILIASNAVQYLRGNWRFDKASLYSLLVALFFAISSLVNASWVSGEFIAAAIIMHFFTWYLHYLHKFKDNSKVNRNFMFEMLLINVFVIGAFFLSSLHSEGAAFRTYFFSRDYYFLWALLHIFINIRPDFIQYFGINIKSHIETV